MFCTAACLTQFICEQSINSYINNSWACQNLIDSDGDIVPAAPSNTLFTEHSFTGNWTNLKQAFSEAADVPSFNHGHTIFYFVSQTAADELPSGDTKSINEAAKHFLDSGHV